jgi:anaerobic magnesium-protoporphyrin IX monomethyl ester cyclase
MTFKKILITSPNYSWFGKRSWPMLPYTLGLINGCISNDYNTFIYDPNFDNDTFEKVKSNLKDMNPDLILLSSISTDYIAHSIKMIEIIRESLPNTKIIFGGVIPTVLKNEVFDKIKNIDLYMFREAEERLLKTIQALETNNFQELDLIEGISYLKDNKLIHNKFDKTDGFVYDLDKVNLPDYGNLDILKYGNIVMKKSVQTVARNYPFAISSTSRGCPFNCTFCSGWTVTGKKVRMRNSKNVLDEIDYLYKKGIREIIYLDDHFLFNKKRAKEIMYGLIERKYDLTWKCVNVNIANLDAEILSLMKLSGCYQIAVSIESGDDYVLKNLIKKPFIDLERSIKILDFAKKMDFELIANFVIGYPDETWLQIRKTFDYASKLNIDYAIFHIATPLPQTELMKMYIDKGLIDEKIKNYGFCEPNINTSEFTSNDLKVLRAYEWERINFSSLERINKIAKMQGLTYDECMEWRRKTLNGLGIVKEDS